MAKTSWINRNERKRATVKKYAALRAELKAKKDYVGLRNCPATPARRGWSTAARLAAVVALLFAVSRFRDLLFASWLPRG